MFTRKIVAALAATVSAGLATSLLISPAEAAVARLGYDVDGSTHVARSNSDLTLGPGTLDADYDLSSRALSDGKVALPSAVSNFAILGLLPVQAKVSFAQAGPAVGHFDGGTIKTHVDMTLKLSDVRVAGLPTPVGDDCRTEAPVSLDLQSPKDVPFNPLKGGTVAGSYTIPNFTDCGLTTLLVNLLVPGSGNTISLTLSNGHVVK